MVLVGAVLGEPPVNQYLPASRTTGGTGQYNVPSQQYGTPSPQYGAPSVHVGGRTGQFPGVSSQYNGPSTQYGTPTRQYLTPSNQIFGRTNQYSKPPTQYGNSQGRINQHSTSSGQYAGLEGRINKYSTPSSQYDTPAGQFGAVSQYGYSGASGQYSGAGSQYNSNQNSAANQVPILRFDNNPNAGDGSYSYSYETANGIQASEQGQGTVYAQGEYSYTSPEGKQVHVRYTADENGFHPEGDDIPKPSAAILKSIELNRAAEAQNGYQREGQYSGSLNQEYGVPSQQHTGAGQLASQGAFASRSHQYKDQNEQTRSFGQQFAPSGAATLHRQSDSISRQNLTPQIGGSIGQNDGYKY